MEKEEEQKEMQYLNKNLNWGKKNPMVKEKYVPPQPAEFHDSTVNYLNDVRAKRKSDGVNMQNRYIDRMINDPKMQEYERLNIVR